MKKMYWIITVTLMVLLISVVFFVFFFEPEVVVTGRLYLDDCPPFEENCSVVWCLNADGGSQYYLADDTWTLMAGTSYSEWWGKHIVIRGFIRQYEYEGTIYKIIKIIEIGDV